MEEEEKTTNQPLLYRTDIFFSSSFENSILLLKVEVRNLNRGAF